MAELQERISLCFNQLSSLTYLLDLDGTCVLDFWVEGVVMVAEGTQMADGHLHYAETSHVRNYFVMCQRMMMSQREGDGPQWTVLLFSCIDWK